MITNIENFVSGYHTLIIVIIGVLVMCFLYWWLFCKNKMPRSKVVGGHVNYSSFTYIKPFGEKKSAMKNRLFRCIGAKCNEKSKVFVLNDYGIEKLKGIVEKKGEWNNFYYSFLDTFCLLDCEGDCEKTEEEMKSEREREKNMYEDIEKVGLKLLIRDPIKVFGKNNNREMLSKKCVEMKADCFDFESVLKFGGMKEEIRKKIVDSYNKLVNEVVKKNSKCFDFVSYIGQLGGKPLPEDGVKRTNDDDFKYSGSISGAVDDESINLIFSSFINKDPIIRAWYKLQGLGKKYITKYYYNESNGNIIDLFNNGERDVLNKCYITIRNMFSYINENKLTLKEGGVEVNNKMDDLCFWVERVKRSGRRSTGERGKMVERLESSYNGVREVVLGFNNGNLRNAVQKLAIANRRIGKGELRGEVGEIVLRGVPDGRAVSEACMKAEKMGLHMAQFDVADIYPAYKLALTILFFIVMFPNFGEIDRNSYIEMIASYVLLVNSFNMFCNVNMEHSWNDTIHNEYVWKKVNVFREDEQNNEMDLTVETLLLFEAKAHKKKLNLLAVKYAKSNAGKIIDEVMRGDLSEIDEVKLQRWCREKKVEFDIEAIKGNRGAIVKELGEYGRLLEEGNNREKEDVYKVVLAYLGLMLEDVGRKEKVYNFNDLRVMFPGKEKVPRKVKEDLERIHEQSNENFEKNKKELEGERRHHTTCSVDDAIKKLMELKANGVREVDASDRLEEIINLS